jgi:hypothetical protein
MRRTVRSAAPLLLLIALPGCATLVGGGPSQPVSLNSTPAGASFTVKSSSGIQMAAGTTPQTLRLPRKNEYQIDFTVPGYKTQSVALTKGTNGWIWGNLLIGWIVGFIVDFATGSAYKLEPSQVQVSLVREVDGSGLEQVYGVVRQLDDAGRIVSEQRVRLVPEP